MQLSHSSWTILLFSILITTSIGAPLRDRIWRGKREKDNFVQLELLYDPEPVKKHLTLVDDYGVKPAPPNMPFWMRSKKEGVYRPDLEEFW